tara:strand:- start:740 stop:1468 length:729 start_codon:yes stop_codon:yes gene_type:complete
MSSTSILLKNISLRFPKQRSILGILLDKLRGKKNTYTALSTINLEIQKGEVIGIIGQNGSGKSTLLRAISGIYPVDSGEVHAAGEISLLAGLGTGFSPHQTGRENAILYGSILGHAEQEMREKLDEIIAFSELGEFIDQPLRTYSSGMRARLGLAVASAIRPDILLIDEVLSVGDPTFKQKSKEKILSMVQDASTVVIVSHSFSLLSDICDRVILLDKGKVVSDDAPETSIKAYHEIKQKKP